MDSTAEQVLNAALALPDEERLEIIEALIVSLQPADRPPSTNPGAKPSANDPPNFVPAV
jgi:hypothetical protein